MFEVLNITGSLDAIRSLVPQDGARITVINKTGSSFLIRNEDLAVATADNRIQTGTQDDLEVADEGAVILQYTTFSSEKRWHVVGGSGIVDASGVSFDPANSNLASTDVQSAIDEHVNDTNGVHGTIGEVVGTNNAQSLQNKSLGGTGLDPFEFNGSGVVSIASFSSSFVRLTGTIERIEGAGSFANQFTHVLNTTSNDIIFTHESTSTTSNKFNFPDGKDLILKPNQAINLQKDNATGRWYLVGGSAAATSGEFNYIENGRAEASTDGWVRYGNSTPGVRPDDFGGTVNATAFDRLTADPPLGDASFRFLLADTGGVVNNLGQGVYYEFTPENGHKTITHLLSMLTETNENYVEGQFGIYLVGSNDGFTSNFQLISPSNPDILAGAPQTFKQFQFPADVTAIRFCIHTQIDNTGEVTLKFDEVELAPSPVATSAVVTDYEEFNVTTNFNNATHEGRIRRVGSNAEISVITTFTGEPSQSGIFYWDMPPGLTGDSDIFRDGLVHLVGDGNVVDNGIANYNLKVRYVNSLNQIELRYLIETNETDNRTRSVAISGSAPIGTYQNGEVINFNCSIPIEGWSANATSSIDLGNREIVVRASNASVSGTSSLMNFSSIIEDTTNSYDGTLFTAPQKGRYLIRVRAESNPTTGNGTYIINAERNGTFFDRIINKRTKDHTTNSARKTGEGSYVIPLEKGDTLGLRLEDSDATGLNASTVSIDLLNSGQTLLETDKVFGEFRSDSGQTMINNQTNTIDFNVVVSDSHNAYNPSNGQYTIPVNGVYAISGNIAMGGLSANVGNHEVRIARNGLSFASHTIPIEGSTVSVNVYQLFELNKGDVITIENFHQNGSNRSLLASQRFNGFCIHRIK